MNKKENNNLIILSTHTMCFCILGMMFLTIISSIGIFKSLINEYNQKMQYNEIVIPHIIGLRSSIADALSSSLPVWKIKKTAARKAAQEMKAVSNYVLNKMQG